MGRLQRGKSGQVMVLLGLLAVVILGSVAIALDQGLAMIDRRSLQGIADSAALAGARSFPQGPATANYVAMQYLARSLKFSLPLPSCSSGSSCPAATYQVAGGAYTIVLTDGANTLDVSVQHSRPTLVAGALGITTQVSGSSARALPPAPRTVGAGYALAGLSGDLQVNGGGTSSPSGDVSGPVYAAGNFGANNVPHAPILPAAITNFDGTLCGSGAINHVDLGGGGDALNYQWSGGSGTQNTNVPAPNVFGGYAPVATGPTYTSLAQAVGADSNWQPGTYVGIYPSGGKLDPGVYQISSVSSTIALGSITNAVSTTSGKADPGGAVVIVLDSSDTGALDITNAVLNGLDDLNPPSFAGPRDPQATHNFVLYAGSGPLGYSGSVTIGPQATTDLSGIVYLPQSTVIFNGNSSPRFTGAVVTASLTINGGGNGTQTFGWICGLNAVLGNAPAGGLTR